MTQHDIDVEAIFRSQISPTQKPKNQKWLVILLVAILIFGVIGVPVYFNMYGYTAHSRANVQLGHATHVYKLAEQWQKDGNELPQSWIGQFQNSPSADTFDNYVIENSNDVHGWYAIECDADGSITRVWHCDNKFTQDEMRVTAFLDIVNEFKNPFRAKSTVVCYPCD